MDFAMNRRNFIKAASLAGAAGLAAEQLEKRGGKVHAGIEGQTAAPVAAVAG